MHNSKTQSQSNKDSFCITSANLMCVMIGMFFKWHMIEERTERAKPISFTQDVVQEFAGSVVGMLLSFEMYTTTFQTDMKLKVSYMVL